MQIAKMSDLKKFFSSIVSSQYKGVKGVVVFDSGIEGPTLGIGMSTHGNEPVGLAVLWDFIQSNKSQEMKKGKLIFTMNNIDACLEYFSTDEEDRKIESRFMDFNMNRITEELEFNYDTSEGRRLNELKPILEEFDYGIDIHSTRSDSTPVIINIGSYVNTELIKGVPIEIIISNIDQIQIGFPLCYFFGGKEYEIPVLGIEAGCHEDGQSFGIAIETVSQLCKNLGIFESDILDSIKPIDYTVYRVKESILFSDANYSISRKLGAFEYLNSETIIASNGIDNIYINKEGGYNLFGTEKGFKPKSISEEVVFLMDKENLNF